MTSRLPVFFVGHGSPMNAVLKNDFTRVLGSLASSFPAPKAVLCVSAHWQADGFFVQSGAHPETIHDFEGFPPELDEIRYPAPGAPGVAARAAALLKPFDARLTEDWGFDHGVWSVLRHVFPRHDVPVTVVSLNVMAGAKAHYEVGKRLAPLREEGVLILGSGNIVHNLRRLDWKRIDATPYPWAVSFDDVVKAALLGHDDGALIDFPSIPGAREAHPTTEHYMPLLPALGAAQGDSVLFPYEGFHHGSLSMRMVRFG